LTFAKQLGHHLEDEEEGRFARSKEIEVVALSPESFAAAFISARALVRARARARERARARDK